MSLVQSLETDVEMVEVGYRRKVGPFKVISSIQIGMGLSGQQKSDPLRMGRAASTAKEV